MGTLREDVVLSSTPHSDPDYTSSSEQSCDTVIYIGAMGQSLSDRELTDHEGPPRSVPRTNPRLPRRPSGSRSSGDEGSNSDSGRSHHSGHYRINKPNYNSVSEYAKHVRVPIKTQPLVHKNMTNINGHDMVCSPPMSPKIGHLPHKANIRTRLNSRFQEEDNTASVSIAKADKVCVSKSVASVSAKVASGQQDILRGEKWIDGPGATSYPEKAKTSSETWVDGPQAFVVKEPEPKVNKHSYNAKMSAEELWVDGPREMLADDKHKHRKPSTGGTRSRSREHSLEPATPSHNPVVKTTPPKVKQAQDSKDRYLYFINHISSKKHLVDISDSDKSK